MGASSAPRISSPGRWRSNSRRGRPIPHRCRRWSRATGSASAISRGRVNSSLLCYYGALIKLERGDVPAAEALLGRVSPEQLGDLAVKYEFMLGEIARRKGELGEARRRFLRALAGPDPFGFRPVIENALRKLEAPASLPGQE